MEDDPTDENERRKMGVSGDALTFSGLKFRNINISLLPCGH